MCGYWFLNCVADVPDFQCICMVFLLEVGSGVDESRNCVFSWSVPDVVRLDDVFSWSYPERDMIG